MKTNNPILVTGGTGFLGSYIIRQLIKQGAAVRATKRKNSRMDLVADVADKVDWYEADLLDLPALEDCMHTVEKIYHSAAMISFDKKQAATMRKINVEGTANVVNIALDFGVKKMLHVSSIAAIGRRKDGEKISEKSKWERNKRNSNYAISKYQAEQEAWRGYAEGLDMVVVNPSVILGPGFWDTGTGQLFDYIWKGGKFLPLGESGFVDVRDVARFCIASMESDISGERFIVNGENRSFAWITGEIATALGKPKPKIPFRPWMQELAWRAEALRCFFSRKAPLITRETARHASSRHFYENQKSLDRLGFVYTPIRKTIVDTGQLFLEGRV